MIANLHAEMKFLNGTATSETPNLKKKKIKNQREEENDECAKAAFTSSEIQILFVLYW